MEQIHTPLKKKYNGVIKGTNSINVNNDNKKNDSNDNGENTNKYALDKTKFTPNTEEALLAEEIAAYFGDLRNFAGFYKVVNTLGVMKSREFLSSVKDDIRSKQNTKYPVRYPARYFMWRYRNKMY